MFLSCFRFWADSKTASWQKTLRAIVDQLTQEGWDCILQQVPFTARDRKRRFYESLEISALHNDENVYCTISRKQNLYCQVRIQNHITHISQVKIENHLTLNCSTQKDLFDALRTAVDQSCRIRRGSAVIPSPGAQI